MGLRFRKSINPGGGARINLSKSGIGFSIGTKGYRYTKTATGRDRTTVSIPGTGISYVKESSSKKHQNAIGPSSAPAVTLRLPKKVYIYRTLSSAFIILALIGLIALLSSQRTGFESVPFLNYSGGIALATNIPLEISPNSSGEVAVFYQDSVNEPSEIQLLSNPPNALPFTLKDYGNGRAVFMLSPCNALEGVYSVYAVYNGEQTAPLSVTVSNDGVTSFSILTPEMQRSLSQTFQIPLLFLLTIASVIAGIIFCVISNELKNKALREHKHACAVKLEELRTKADLLRQEQAKNEKPKEMKSIPIKDPAVEIAKYKYLLDSGAITQEEYDAKKKQFLEM